MFAHELVGLALRATRPDDCLGCAPPSAQANVPAPLIAQTMSGNATGQFTIALLRASAAVSSVAGAP